MQESTTISVWLCPSAGSSPLVELANHYIANGFSISLILGCDPIWRDRSVVSILDLDVKERIRREDMSDGWIIGVDLFRLRKGSSGRQEVRSLRYGPSSTPCPWLEHPVEVAVPMSSSKPAHKQRRHSGTGRDHHLLEEVRSLCTDLKIAWATLSDLGRGPSLSELTKKSRPAYVDTSTIFLADADFDENVAQKLALVSYAQRWPSGWLFSVDLQQSNNQRDHSKFDQEIWSILSNWRTAVVTARSNESTA